MKIHLIRTSEVDPELVLEVAEILSSVSGPLKLYTDLTSINCIPDREVFMSDIKEDDFIKQNKLEDSNNFINYCKPSFPLSRSTANWQTFFQACQTVRTENNIPEGEFVILLTDIANNMNWFSMLDENNPFNGFIHTADWEYYINSNAAFPVAYLVISKVIQKHMFSSFRELNESVHKNPLGCINDFCQNKKEIILKLRTADICPACFNKTENGIDPVILQQCLAILEKLRVGMLYSQGFRQKMPLSKIKITQSNKIVLMDYENMEINLRPLEKALYFLYLKHPEGIPLTHLVDHRQELRHIYGQLATTGALAEIYNSVDSLVDVNSNSASEKISRIRSVFVKKIGDKLSLPYLIKGENREPKTIFINRDYIIWENNLS